MCVGVHLSHGCGVLGMLQVDATANSATAGRFDVQGYPTVVLVSGGRKYEFKGSRSVDDLVAFATVAAALHTAQHCPIHTNHHPLR